MLTEVLTAIIFLRILLYTYVEVAHDLCFCLQLLVFDIDMLVLGIYLVLLGLHASICLNYRCLGLAGCLLFLIFFLTAKNAKPRLLLLFRVGTRVVQLFCCGVGIARINTISRRRVLLQANGLFAIRSLLHVRIFPRCHAH